MTDRRGKLTAERAREMAQSLQAAADNISAESCDEIDVKLAVLTMRLMAKELSEYGDANDLFTGVQVEVS
jgi:uncharacterized protein YegL